MNTFGLLMSMLSILFVNQAFMDADEINFTVLSKNTIVLARFFPSSVVFVWYFFTPRMIVVRTDQYSVLYMIIISWLVTIQFIPGAALHASYPFMSIHSVCLVRDVHGGCLTNNVYI